MKSKTLLMMDPLDMAAVSNIEAMIRFAALIDMHSVETLEAMDDRLASLIEQAETPEQAAFFEAGQALIRTETDNRTGE